MFAKDRMYSIQGPRLARYLMKSTPGREIVSAKALRWELVVRLEWRSWGLGGRNRRGNYKVSDVSNETMELPFVNMSQLVGGAG